MKQFDVKVYTANRSLIAWRGEYESVWDAIMAAHERAEREGADVFGVSAIRVPEAARSAA